METKDDVRQEDSRNYYDSYAEESAEVEDQ